MNLAHPFLLRLIGLVIAVMGYWIVTHYFSADAKWERRRRRSSVRVPERTVARGLELLANRRVRRCP